MIDKKIEDRDMNIRLNKIENRLDVIESRLDTLFAFLEDRFASVLCSDLPSVSFTR
jgi:division protein CdvB (Snf7/Vps24/ESCRT-III family)